MTQKGQKKRSWKNWIGGKFNAAGSWIKGHWKPIAGAAAAAAAAGAAIYLGTKDNGPAPPAHHTSPPAAPAAPPAAPQAPTGHAMPGCSQADIDAFRGKPCKKTDDRRFLLKCSKYFREGTGSVMRWLLHSCERHQGLPIRKQGGAIIPQNSQTQYIGNTCMKQEKKDGTKNNI